tara:strand:+ start:1461 stop:3491 length:2031 start_codon:yes stop_codon:yes gene_type:complete
MSLLYPEFLWALLLNIIPIFIHLFNYQKHETIYFSDVTLFKDIEEKTKKRSQLKNILLLLSRILLVSSIVLAFCFPYEKNNKINNYENLKKIGIYLDNSFSMSRLNKNQSLLESAKDDLMKLIDNLPDNTEYIFTTNNKLKNKPYSIRKNELKKEIIKTAYSPISLTYSEIIDIQKEQFKGDIINTFWLTDLQKNSFDLSNHKLVKNDQINLLKYSSNEMGNLSIDSVWFQESNRQIKKNETIQVKATNHSNSELEFQIKLNINNGEVLNQSYTKIKPYESKIIEFIFSVDTNGKKIGKLSIISNDMNSIKYDDNYYFSYSINENFKVVNLYEGDNESNSYLKALFSSVEKTKYEEVNFREGYNDYDLNADLIILNELINIDKQLINTITPNKNILILPSTSKNSDYKNLNNFLNIKFSSLKNSKLELDIESVDKNYFKNIFSSFNGNINLPYFNYHYLVSKNPNANYLINFSNGDPFLIKYSESNRDFFYLTSNLNDSVSNFKEHALFVPIMLRIKEKSSSDFIKQYDINHLDRIRIKNEFQQNGDVKIINNLELPTISFFPKVSNSKGNSLIFLENEIEFSGHYYLMKKDSLIDVISVNGTQSESEMNFIKNKEFNQEIINLNIEENIKFWNISEKRYPEIISLKSNNNEYWKYFILLGIVFLILEIIIIKKFT